MNKYIKYIIGIIILGLILFVCLKNKTNNDTLNENTVIITTDSHIQTLQNDGGSNFNRKYKVNFNNNTITYLEDYYEGFKGYKYKNKVLSKNRIDNNQKKELMNLFQDIINNREEYQIDKNKTYNYYIFTNYKYERILIYDENVINNLNNLLKN